MRSLGEHLQVLDVFLISGGVSDLLDPDEVQDTRREDQEILHGDLLSFLIELIKRESVSFPILVVAASEEVELQCVVQ